MKMERIKNVVLVLLIGCSVFLTVRIWFSYELWPYGTDLLTGLKNSSFVQGIARIIPGLSQNADISKRGLYSIYTPERFVVTGTEKKTVLASGNDSFWEMSRLTNELLSLLYTTDLSKDLQEAGEAEWQAPLKSSGILVDYTYPISTALYGQFLAGRDFPASQQIASFSKIIISLTDSSENRITLFIKDESSRKFYRVTADFQQKGEILSLTDTALETAGDNYKFAFEINLDRKTPEEMDNATTEPDGSEIIDANVSRNVFLDSLVLLPLLESEVVSIHSTRPSLGAGAKAQEVLDLFGYNAASFRRLTDQENNVLFVENFSTLKLSADGMIEYRATDPTKGIELKNQVADDSSVNAQYEILGNATNFISALWDILADEGAQTEIRIACPVVENRTGNYKLTFTYYFDGVPIFGDLENGSFIEMEIQEGRMVSYRQTIRFYESTGKKEEGRLVMDAVDEFYAQMAQEQSEIVIKNVLLSYRGDAETMQPDWTIIRDDGNIVPTQ